MLWVAAPICFYGFFQAGEIIMPSVSYNPARHLAWEDVAMDDTQNPSMLMVHLKVSKTDQFGMCMRRELCSVEAFLCYMGIQNEASL